MFNLMKLPNLHSSSGFSLIEILVVVSIMVTMLSLGAAYYNGFSRTATLDGAAQQLKAHLRFSQTQALAGEKFGSCTSPFNGYYLSIRNDGIAGFGYSNNYFYTIGEACGSPSPGTATAKTPLSPVILPNGVSITTSNVAILFQSIKGVTFYNSTGCCSSPSAVSSISITLSNGSQNRTVTVTSDGKIQ